MVTFAPDPNQKRNAPGSALTPLSPSVIFSFIVCLSVFHTNPIFMASPKSKYRFRPDLYRELNARSKSKNKAAPKKLFLNTNHGIFRMNIRKIYKIEFSDFV